MGEQHHIVQKLIFEIELSSDEDDAFGLQTKISDGYERLLLAALCEIFDKLIGEDEVLRIDKLEINLGEVSPQYLEYDLPEKTRKEMEQALDKLLYEVRQSPHGNAEVRIETPAGETITVQATVEQRTYSALSTLAYLLEYGVLPWTEDRKEKPTLRWLVAQAMEKYPGQLRRVLQQLSHKPYVFRRLALQLPGEQLQYLAAITGSSFSSKLPVFFKQLQQWIQALPKPGEQTVQRKNITTEKLTVFFWEETLRYFSVNEQFTSISGSAPDVLFLTEMLHSVLRHFEIKITARQIKQAGTKLDPVLEIVIKKLLEEAVQTESKETNGKQHEQRRAGESFKIIDDGKKDKQVGPGDIDRILEAMSVDPQLPEPPELKDGGIYVGNAGLVILAAYIPRFFKNLGYVSGKEFVDEESKWKAVHMLQWLVNGDREKGDNTEANEHDLLLNKLLCGIDIAEPVPAFVQLSEKEKDAGIELLSAIIANWPLIKKVSVPAFQVTFLVKEGKLERMAAGWNLFIHRDSTVDLLIDRLPWSISMILFPWNKETIFVEW